MVHRIDDDSNPPSVMCPYTQARVWAVGLFGHFFVFGLDGIVDGIDDDSNSPVRAGVWAYGGAAAPSSVFSYGSYAGSDSLANAGGGGPDGPTSRWPAADGPGGSARVAPCMCGGGAALAAAAARAGGGGGAAALGGSQGPASIQLCVSPLGSAAAAPGGGASSAGSPLVLPAPWSQPLVLDGAGTSAVVGVGDGSGTP
jgi:hypothetical protein